MNEDKKGITEPKEPDNLVVYDPGNPSYEKRHLCIYLRELLDEAEKGVMEEGRGKKKNHDGRGTRDETARDAGCRIEAEP